jgi:hypothetical protein
LLYEIHSNKLEVVLEKGSEKVLNIIGNHSKGTQFINGNHLISKNLEHTFDQLFSKIPNVYYGRIDLKYDSFDNLIKGINFKIIEMNGIISEPTHIYDKEKSTYLKALKDIRTHWKLMYEIAVQNHKIHHIKYEKITVFVKSLLKLKKYTKQLRTNKL